MGQLDEAIRAHLELKRRHGASEEELQAEEQEALGPVRREPPGQQAAAPDEASREPEVGMGVEASDADDEAPSSYDDLPQSYDGPPQSYDEPPQSYDEPPQSYDEPPQSYDEPLEGQPPETFHEPDEALAEGFDEPFETAGEGAETAELSEDLEEAGPAEPTEALDPIPGQPEPIAPEAGDTPPRGFDAVEEPEPEGDEEGEDVLEETPDFLQETPEHDRLWFEQKPPRDFDFDE